MSRCILKLFKITTFFKLGKLSNCTICRYRDFHKHSYNVEHSIEVLFSIHRYTSTINLNPNKNSGFLRFSTYLNIFLTTLYS